MCAMTPSNPISLSAGSTANLSVTINVPNNTNPGEYTIKVDTHDTAGAPSHSTTLALTVAQHFLVTSSTKSQTVKAGQTSGAYALQVKPVGASFSAAVSLACTAGLPGGAQCIFTPSTPVTPCSSAVDVVMNISTIAHSAHLLMPLQKDFRSLVVWLPLAATLLGISILWSPGRKRVRPVLGFGIVGLALLLLVSCAGVSNGGDGGGQPPLPVTYHITVTGVSSGTPPDAGQSTTVILVVD
jgi:hypothetical protein